MLIKVPSAANIGLETIKIDVEVNVSGRGLPKFYIVGLPSKAVDESRQRVVTAIINSDVAFPRKRLTINLAPADIPKEGSFYDFPISVGILSIIFDLPIPKKSLFFGELSLDGGLRHTKGVFLLALFAKEAGYDKLFVPKSSANEATAISGVTIYPVENLKQLIEHFKYSRKIKPCKTKKPTTPNQQSNVSTIDMKDIIGNEFAKRAIEIAAAGGHNVLLSGPPGSGKTMLAKALPGIMPVLEEKESIEVTKIYSATGNIPPNGTIITQRPFRSPHHTTSTAGLIGGGSKPQPGEVSLAHRGILFLDEFPEFSRISLEALRQPMENGVVTISRSKGRVTFPAGFTLVAAQNPCPCGYLNHPAKECICTPIQISRYKKRISGPLLDRIDLHLTIDPVPVEKFKDSSNLTNSNDSSKKILKRVTATRNIQSNRYKDLQIHTNSEMSSKNIYELAHISDDAHSLLLKFMDKLHLSARSYFRVIKVSRTIADLGTSDTIKDFHVAEALQYRVER